MGSSGNDVVQSMSGRLSGVTRVRCVKICMYSVLEDGRLSKFAVRFR